MRPSDKKRAQAINKKLLSFNKSKMPLHGISSDAQRNCFVEQIIESMRRTEYISRILNRDISQLRLDPANKLFDPIKAAVLHYRAGNLDEAIWLIFLSVHFGKHLTDGWQLVRDVYGRLNSANKWSWEKISANPKNFRKWLDKNQDNLKYGKIKRRFGNHRKYESLDAWSENGTGAILESYVSWIDPPKNHQDIISSVPQQIREDPKALFEYLYRSMNAVHRFGRTAKFDFLTMLGKLNFINIKPGSAFIKESTGPLRGAKLLFGGDIDADMRKPQLDTFSMELADYIGIGMQEMEDALCNWQKSPEKFKRFRG